MKLSEELLAQGFRLERPTPADFPAWFETKKICYKGYVDHYYGGWNDEAQLTLNAASFEKSMNMTCFLKILLNQTAVGFVGYDEQADCITGITIHMTEAARNRGIGSLFLQHISERSRETCKPAYLRVFKTNTARLLYERFGFETYDETASHYLMRLSDNR